MAELVMVVEDDAEMGSLLVRGLTDAGYRVDLFTDGVAALAAAPRQQYVAAVFDVMLPGMSGYELCRHLRTSGSTLPVMMLTARDALEDRVFGLDAGADDYLPKPFHFEELAARLRAMVRRERITNRAPLLVGNLSVDVATHTASVDGKPLLLSPKEFGVLRVLAAGQGSFVSRDDILRDVWGSVHFVDHNVAEQYISYLRRKLLHAAAAVEIATRRGSGYRLGPRE
jgi:DNA-binding response OmpR family regulator